MWHLSARGPCVAADASLRVLGLGVLGVWRFGGWGFWGLGFRVSWV